MAATAGDFFGSLERRFRADKAAGLRAVYGFDITGPGGGRWHARIADGTCVVGEGATGDEDVTVTSTAEDWTRMTEGALDAQAAYVAGRLRVAGDMALALRLRSLFL